MQTLTTPAVPARPDDWQAWIAYGMAWAAQPAPATTPPTPPRPETPARAAGTRCLELTVYREDVPGPRWQALHRATWRAYRAWYLADGMEARPGLVEARDALARHMPELVPTWHRLVELAGHDPIAARLLTMWRLPTFAAGCSQLVLDAAPGDPLLVRNYDYDPLLFEGVVATTNYSGRRRVLGTSDLLWGLLDGMNSDGLTVSLTYGGRPARPDDAPGFAIPLVLRYLLETCADVPEATATLRRLPIAQAYNLALVDTRGGHASVFVAPGEQPVVSALRATTNHRLERVEHPHAADRLDSPQRQRVLLSALDGPADPAAVTDLFLRPPLRREAYRAGFGTLYTAAYRPARGEVTYLWPGTAWRRHFEDGQDGIRAWVNEM